MRIGIIYICDDCREQAAFRSYKKARAAGWALAADYKNCYCPKCAPPHRLGGANGRSNGVIRHIASKSDNVNIDKDSITSQEITLIKNFRKLSPYLKKVMLQTICEWSDKEDTESLHKKI